MIYLLAKYTLLFLMASILGFLLGYWWSRRSFVDVSESYEDLRMAAKRTDAANWEQLWKRLDTTTVAKGTDLSAVIERLDGVSAAVAKIPRPAPVDLATVETGLEALARKVDEIPASVTPVRHELDSIRGRIDALPRIEIGDPVDIAPVLRQIDALGNRLHKLPQPPTADLKPIESRLRSIEGEIERLGKRMTSRARPAADAEIRDAARPGQAPGQPKILSAALYGKKDDLKRISGVGPKLEELLNTNGIFYFWQVASWSSRDIDIIDERLDTFRGRILRDDWVSQANRLKELPGAASMPTV